MKLIVTLGIMRIISKNLGVYKLAQVNHEKLCTDCVPAAVVNRHILMIVITRCLDLHSSAREQHSALRSHSCVERGGREKMLISVLRYL